MYGLPWANFYKTHKSTGTKWAYLLYRFSYQLDSECGQHAYKVRWNFLMSWWVIIFASSGSNTAWPWRCTPHKPLTHQEIFIQWLNVTSQKTWIFSDTAVETSNLAFFILDTCIITHRGQCCHSLLPDVFNHLSVPAQCADCAEMS